mmetsp:Transcript_10026/g.19689  ORF Transcript_10026/g.19689 Transcript_10026/m.19689 type:complete len:265 (+) Transcript_10026:722-1516(+)
MVHEPLERRLEIVRDHFAFGAVGPLLPGEAFGSLHVLDGEEAHPLELVEGGVVTGVDLVAAVDVPGAEEGVGAGAEVLALVGGGVRPEECGVVDVVGVAGGAAGVVGGDAEVVEALLGGDDGVFGVVDGVLDGEGGEVFLDFGADDADGVGGPGVQALADEGGDVGGDVVVGVVAQVAGRVGVFRGGGGGFFDGGEEGGGRGGGGGGTNRKGGAAVGGGAPRVATAGEGGYGKSGCCRDLHGTSGGVRRSVLDVKEREMERVRR